MPNKALKPIWNGPYDNRFPPQLERAKELVVETLRKELAKAEADARQGLNGSGDVSGPAAHSDTL